MTRILVFALVPLLLAGCQTSEHRPVMFKTAAEVECPDWAVLVDVDGRFYCIDRRFFEDDGSHDR